MAEVDPRLGQIPKELLEDREVRLYFEDLERFLHDIWIRTGGGNDEIANLDIRESYPWPTGLQASDIDKAFNFPQPTNEPIFRAVTATQSYTANDYEFINDKGNSTITLVKYPVENSVIIIRNGDGSNINLSGNGKTINGSLTGILRREQTAIELYYFIDSDEWLAK